MSRSVWKIPYINNRFFSGVLSRKKVFVVWERNCVISPFFLNKKFRVHNGVWLLSVYVKAPMIGHKFGEFSFSRRFGRIKHKLRKKKK
jgi:Ribosomal protein S19